MAATAEMSAVERAHLSREINRAIDLDAEIKAKTEELRELKARLWDAIGEPGFYRSNRGHVEIVRSNVLSVPETAYDALHEILGDRYPDLVDEVVRLKARSGLRRLLFEPGPTERQISDRLREIVQVREQVSFTFKGAA